MVAMTLLLTLLASGMHYASGHYIFQTLVVESTFSMNAVRQPQNNSPIRDYTGSGITCNDNPFPAYETLEVVAGNRLGFVANTTLYHEGPAAIYLGEAPGSVAYWDGGGNNWFKIEEWGATYNPLSFSDVGQSALYTTIPKATRSGEYLVRIEQIGLHATGTPEFFVSCAQIKVTRGGNGNPPKVTIPGYIPKDDPSVNVNIYEELTNYKCPGPTVWRG